MQRPFQRGTGLGLTRVTRGQGHCFSGMAKEDFPEVLTLDGGWEAAPEGVTGKAFAA